jgi:hypothetical protein
MGTRGKVRPGCDTDHSHNLVLRSRTSSSYTSSPPWHSHDVAWQLYSLLFQSTWWISLWYRKHKKFCQSISVMFWMSLLTFINWRYCDFMYPHKWVMIITKHMQSPYEYYITCFYFAYWRWSKCHTFKPCNDLKKTSSFVLWLEDCSICVLSMHNTEFCITLSLTWNCKIK